MLSGNTAEDKRDGLVCLTIKVTLDWWGVSLNGTAVCSGVRVFWAFVLYVLKLRPNKCNGPPEVNL